MKAGCWVPLRTEREIWDGMGRLFDGIRRGDDDGWLVVGYLAG